MGSVQSDINMTDRIDPVFVPLRAGLEFSVWRVVKLELVKVPERDWGKFYSGDCYVLYDGRYGGQHVYYWIGEDSSIDEQAVAAIKAVVLDNESQRFRKLFPDGVITLKVGADSGLTHVTD